MGLQVCGWVEISWIDDFSSRDYEEHAWIASLNLFPFVSVTDVVSQILFGYTNKIEFSGYHSHFKERGVPTNLSDIVLSVYKKNQDFEDKFRGDGCFGYTYAYLDEVETVLSTETSALIEPNNWWINLIEKIKVLYGDFDTRAVRFIVWFSY